MVAQFEQLDAEHITIIGRTEGTSNLQEVGLSKIYPVVQSRQVVVVHVLQFMSI